MLVLGDRDNDLANALWQRGVSKTLASSCLTVLIGSGHPFGSVVWIRNGDHPSGDIALRRGVETMDAGEFARELVRVATGGATLDIYGWGLNKVMVVSNCGTKDGRVTVIAGGLAYTTQEGVRKALEGLSDNTLDTLDDRQKLSRMREQLRVSGIDIDALVHQLRNGSTPPEPTPVAEANDLVCQLDVPAALISAGQVFTENDALMALLGRSSAHDTTASLLETITDWAGVAPDERGLQMLDHLVLPEPRIRSVTLKGARGPVHLRTAPIDSAFEPQFLLLLDAA